MPSIFLSYSSSDELTARALVTWLESVGFDDYFLDRIPEHGLAPGERWHPALIRAAEQSSVFLFLLSSKWLASTWCRAELLFATRRDRDIFPIAIEPMELDTLPEWITSHWTVLTLEVPFPIAGLKALRHGLQRTGIAQGALQWPPQRDVMPVPYRGMAPLTHEDEAVFFGREAAILRGLNQMSRLREHGLEHMLVILGPSGAGKSSYLRAGLWPRLYRDDRHFIALPVIRPERSVLNGEAGLVKSLEETYRRFGGTKNKADIRAALEAPDGLTRQLLELQELVSRGLAEGAPTPHVVISVDQADELFEPDDSGKMSAENQHFLRLFSHALTSTRAPDTETNERLPPRPLAIITLRAVSLTRLQMETSLTARARVIFELAALEEAELKEVIEGPARRLSAAGWPLKIHPFLTQRLVSDSRGPETLLALLAFTLERLFREYGRSGELLVSHDDAIGGVRGAITAAVEIAREKSATRRGSALSSDDYELALRRGFIPWLARVDFRTDQRLRRVARWEEIPPDIRPLFQDLADARLLMRGARRVEGHADTIDVIRDRSRDLAGSMASAEQVVERRVRSLESARAREAGERGLGR